MSPVIIRDNILVHRSDQILFYGSLPGLFCVCIIKLLCRGERV